MYKSVVLNAGVVVAIDPFVLLLLLLSIKVTLFGVAVSQIVRVVVPKNKPLFTSSYQFQHSLHRLSRLCPQGTVALHDRSNSIPKAILILPILHPSCKLDAQFWFPLLIYWPTPSFPQGLASLKMMNLSFWFSLKVAFVCLILRLASIYTRGLWDFSLKIDSECSFTLASLSIFASSFLDTYDTA